MPLTPSSARAPNKWQEYRDAVLAAIQLSHDLKIIEQLEALQNVAAGRAPFTSKRQPASRTPKVFAASELQDVSDAESEAEVQDDEGDSDDEHRPAAGLSPRREPPIREWRCQ